jgi:hypothetical protein
MYRSQLFRKSVAWADAHGHAWAVLSARHGLLMPTDVICPYNVTLADMPRVNRERWAVTTRQKIFAAFGGSTYIVLAGADYRAAVAGLPHTVPMEGLGIGQQLAWLTNNTPRPAAVAA